MVAPFCKTIGSKLVWRTVFYTIAQAEQPIARYINGFCNSVQRHSALDCRSTAQIERTALR
ncbi:hypothetical protein NZL82_06615 [Sphingomonas sanguinis]|uniref:hypothetical protein n=1 Tax=Sphingomonas sp. LC-1 TaxID=3110957 RepID=UPI0021BA84CA|nr:hypothetical protein [Sphingomonas sp. LC-1]MCT8001549.1 hypothetical protein [Sphingomonas sp. LC-1]